MPALPMRRYRYAALFALIPALALQGCPAVIGAGGFVAMSSMDDRRTTGTQLDDSAIESRANSRIAERIGERGRIHVAAFNRTVLLTGDAWDEATRAEAERIALEVPNVRSVTNEIRLSSASSLSERAGDTQLTAVIKGRFMNAERLNPVHVKVITDAGVVYLLGLVTQTEAETATELARTTGGVRKVVKVFEYCKETDELCRRPQQPAEKPKPPRA
jgi:osmotically-inducible protein OsmY